MYFIELFHYNQVRINEHKMATSIVNQNSIFMTYNHSMSKSMPKVKLAWMEFLIKRYPQISMTIFKDDSLSGNTYLSVMKYVERMLKDNSLFGNDTQKELIIFANMIYKQAMGDFFATFKGEKIALNDFGSEYGMSVIISKGKGIFYINETKDGNKIYQFVPISVNQANELKRNLNKVQFDSRMTIIDNEWFYIEEKKTV